MNYKLLFPTYRNRYRFVRQHLRRQPNEGFLQALNLGTGEGDYDPMIASHGKSLTACDINERDVAFAQSLNTGVPNLNYRIEDALNLSFPDNHFDLIISVDVIEHVGKPHRMLQEVARVLQPGGQAVITFPQWYFPWTYDPINRIRTSLKQSPIHQGAYAFGHEYLLKPEEFRKWAEELGLEVLQEKALTGHLAALLEMYWTGWVQRFLKDNARNVSADKQKSLILRPSTREPLLVYLTDALCALDAMLFGRSRYSVGRGFVLKKRQTS
jgi:2-polyprenyl-3-methyl-5-hydroxy-6-metoxy-1,4-benzoquinol methylase